MKNRFLHAATILVTAGILGTSCRSHSDSSQNKVPARPGQSAPVSGIRVTSVTPAPADPSPAAAITGIPDRPEKLNFPPLTYEPPSADQYRVVLKSGPVAYVVPDRELPLVNIVIYAHTGDYVEPVGKEGLAELTGYLLARGGKKATTAEEM